MICFHFSGQASLISCWNLEGRRAAALGGLEILRGQQQSQIVLLALPVPRRNQARLEMKSLWFFSRWNLKSNFSGWTRYNRSGKPNNVLLGAKGQLQTITKMFGSTFMDLKNLMSWNAAFLIIINHRTLNDLLHSLLAKNARESYQNFSSTHHIAMVERFAKTKCATNCKLEKSYHFGTVKLLMGKFPLIFADSPTSTTYFKP